MRAKIVSNNEISRQTQRSGGVRSLAAKARKMLSIVTGPKVDQATFDARSAECERCGFLKRRKAKQYCRACGCPNWHLAELSVKLWFAELECPEGRFESVSKRISGQSKAYPDAPDR